MIPITAVDVRAGKGFTGSAVKTGNTINLPGNGLRTGQAVVYRAGRMRRAAIPSTMLPADPR